MNSYTELYAVELSDAEGHPEGLEVSAAKTYSGYSCETSYFVTVMDMETLDEIDGTETTFERLERDFNTMLAKYGGAGRIVRM